MFFLTYVMAHSAGGLRVILPDFDLYGRAAAVAEVPDRLQHAISRGYRRQVPKSSCLEGLQADKRFRDGWWLWLNIDVDDIGCRSGSKRRAEQKRTLQKEDRTGELRWPR